MVGGESGARQKKRGKREEGKEKAMGIMFWPPWDGNYFWKKKPYKVLGKAIKRKIAPGKGE